MKIYSMTATFGKLEHETLTLQPGLNVIHAPNEWGKSTWCAFLVAMLYGLETRTRSTQAVLSDKEHYTPWSGAPMSGSMDLCWNGRDITIQRQTKGRSIFGNFKAFETHTGLPVPELTAVNCGQTLLGVEKSVFTRSAFLRLTDLPVTQDEALRHRLNALVTTGDDSGTAEQLESKLRDLKNRCRYNRTGLLPQAEAEAAALERKLSELDSLHLQSQKLRLQQTELEQQLADLENHRKALAYAKAQEEAAHVVRAQNAREQAAQHAAKLERACAAAASREQAESAMASLYALQQDWASVQEEARLLPTLPTTPDTPGPFQGMKPEEITDTVRADAAAYNAVIRKKPLLWLIPALLAAFAAAAVLLWLPQYTPLAWIALAAAMAMGVFGIFRHIRRNTQAKSIRSRYGTGDPNLWLRSAEDYVNQVDAYYRALGSHQAALDALAKKQDALRAETTRLCGELLPQVCIAQWQHVISLWDDLEDARQDLRRAESHVRALQAMAEDAPPPAAPDTLTYSEADTVRMIAAVTAELHRLHSRLGQCQGQMESIGQRTVLESRLNALRQRIGQLEDTYAALTVAQETLQTARAELQRRFAPKITQRAQHIMDRLTGGRYDRLRLAQDLSVHAAARDEDTLRTALWRSDGTTDQLYLALRLAVARELTPEAPLILDDALVRFDDQRLKSAMDVLREEAEQKQVLLFTCHRRELECQ